MRARRWTVALVTLAMAVPATPGRRADAAPPAAAPPRVAAADPAGGPKTAEDVYRYLDDPQMVGEGQQPPHVDLRPYGDARTAAADLTERTAPGPYLRSLDGAWRFRLFDRPDDVPAGFAAGGYDVSRWPTASVPHTWQSDFTDHPMFRNIPEEIWPDDPPRVPRDVNPTGAYVRTIDVPRSWSGGRTFLRFEGVTSGYFVWVNGGYAGYDQGGYTPAEFDVTALLHPGVNRVAVQVHRWGSGSYLEDYDQWRYSGIFRDVTLYRTPATYLRDAYVTTSGDKLTVRVDAAGAAGTYPVKATLRDHSGRTVATMNGTVDGSGPVTLSTTVANPQRWSAETPNLYALVLEMNGHVASQPVGFRDIEVRDRQVLVDGGRIMVKGTNRAETDPDTGRAATRERQRADLALMKRLHLNAVRTSHYPSDPYWYRLADRYGLWVDDEVDIETHAHESCPGVCLAEKPEWQAAFADRFAAMVGRDKNHPSVFMWDTGNEAGLGRAHFAMAAWADANEPTRLLYHQSNSPDGDAPYADVSGPRYPTPASLESKARTFAKPIIMGEYAHAMGNGLGNFDQFWALARKYPNMQGGFIWDWAEANLRQPLVFTPDSSGSGIQAFAVGKPGQADGHDGRALQLSSLDDYVDVFRDRRLDLTDEVRLDAWVKPGAWSGSFPIVTKGRGYALQMRDQSTLEFGVTAGDGYTTVAAPVPADWYGAWHHVTGGYDGAALRLSIDGAEVATAARTGAIDPGLYEVNVGRNAETQQDNGGNYRLARGLIDQVRVYDTWQGAGERPVLALDFERFQRRGDFLSLGISLSGTDGLVGSDRYVQPETVEMAWAQAPLRFTAVDAAAGRVRATNEQQAGTLAVDLRWSLVETGRTLREGTVPLRLGPGQSRELSLGAAPANPQDRQRFLNLSARTVADLPWARRGWEFAHDQIPVGGHIVPGVLPGPPPPGPAPRITRDAGSVTVTGSGWRYRFDARTGVLTSMDVAGRQLLRAGPRLDVYRPPTSNETYDWGTADRNVWHQTGLDALATTVTGLDAATDGGAAVVTVRSTAAGPGKAALLAFDQTMRYRIDAAGTITLGHDVATRGSRVGSLPYLPRVGVYLQVPDELERFAYYGEGPAETYNDRRSGSAVGVYRSTVDDQYVRYSRPQAYGNHTGARWATLSDGRSAGLLVGSTGADLDVSVTPYDDLDRAEYDHQLPLVRNRGWVTLHAEAGETGMGETPNSVLAPYRVSAARPHSYELVVRPLSRSEVRAGGVPSSTAAAPCPPDAAVSAPADVQPGTPLPVDVTVTGRCADGLRDTRVALGAPDGWTVTPSTVTLGGAGTAHFTVTAPPGTDVGAYELTATVTSASPAGFATTVRAGATVRAPLPAGARWVSDLPFVTATNGWGPVERDQSNGEQPAGDGRRLGVGGTGYDKGIGAHAASVVAVDVPAGCTAFRASVGVDDETGGGGSVAFEVWVDGERRAASGVLRGGAAAQPIAADVTGAARLELRVTDGGDGNGQDHADWAHARLLCGGAG